MLLVDDTVTLPLPLRPVTVTAGGHCALPLTVAEGVDGGVPLALTVLAAVPLDVMEGLLPKEMLAVAVLVSVAVLLGDAVVEAVGGGVEEGVGGVYVHDMVKLAVVVPPPYTPTRAYTVVLVAVMVTCDAAPQKSSDPPAQLNVDARMPQP